MRRHVSSRNRDPNALFSPERHCSTLKTARQQRQTTKCRGCPVALLPACAFDWAGYTWVLLSTFASNAILISIPFSICWK